MLVQLAANVNIFSSVSSHLEAMKSPDPNLSGREKAHIKAMQIFASGNRPKAMEIWQAILIDYPKGYINMYVYRNDHLCSL